MNTNNAALHLTVGWQFHQDRLIVTLHLTMF